MFVESDWLSSIITPQQRSWYIVWYIYVLLWSTHKNPEFIFRPQPLVLDDKGQTIDSKTGEAIQLIHHTPTLKVSRSRGKSLISILNIYI